MSFFRFDKKSLLIFLQILRMFNLKGKIVKSQRRKDELLVYPMIFSLMSKSIFTHTKILLWHIFSAVALQIPQKNAVWPTLYIETLITQWFIFDNLALFNAGIVLMLFDARLGSSFQKWGLEVIETTFLLKSITILSRFNRLH